MTIINTTIQNRRIGDPLPPEEISRILAAMRQLEPLDIPGDVVAELEDWERRVNQHGIDRADVGLEHSVSPCHDT